MGDVETLNCVLAVQPGSCSSAVFGNICSRYCVHWSLMLLLYKCTMELFLGCIFSLEKNPPYDNQGLLPWTGPRKNSHSLLWHTGVSMPTVIPLQGLQQILTAPKPGSRGETMYNLCASFEMSHVPEEAQESNPWIHQRSNTATGLWCCSKEGKRGREWGSHIP